MRKQPIGSEESKFRAKAARWMARVQGAMGNELKRALEVARSSLRSDLARSRAVFIIVAAATTILVCLTLLVERGRAATIRALERAGLSNLYLMRADGAGASRSGPLRMTTEAAGRFRIVSSPAAVVALRRESDVVDGFGSEFSVPVYAVAGPLERVFGISAKRGRILGDLDASRKSPYCLIGENLSRRAGVLGDPIGRLLSVGGRSYEIVGELEPVFSESANVGDLPALDWDRSIVVPLGAEPSAPVASESEYPVDAAVFRFRSPAEAERAARLGASWRDVSAGGLRISAPAQTLQQFKQARRTFDVMITAIQVLTSFSAILAISSILSSCVIARSFEIGIRRAVGARARDVLLQFQVEAVLLGAAGGGAGLLLGLCLSTLFLREPNTRFEPLPFFSLVLLAGSSIAIGLLGGIVPALRAARLDPAATLREG